MKLGIYFNANQTDRAEAEKLVFAAEREGATAEIFSETDAVFGVDRLVALGGDGTMLRVAKRAASLKIPLVGVNFGRLGFLTEFEREMGEEAVRLALYGKEIVSRTMLEVSLNGAVTHCLNECAILHGISPAAANRISHIRVAIDGSMASEFLADGLIVATPTGSTAYSLSAGGCIMTPDCAAFLLTPVCAFSMRSRPIAYSDNRTLAVSLPEDRELLLYGDGEFLGAVRAKDELLVKRSSRTADFLTRSKAGYFARLAEKIN